MPSLHVDATASGRTYAEGKKIGWSDGVRTLWARLISLVAVGHKPLRGSGVVEPPAVTRKAA